MHYSFKQRLHSVLIGLVSGSLAFLPVSRAWAGSGPGVYEPQDYPSNSEEVADAAEAVRAGMSVTEAVEPQPHPSREYASFLSGLWQGVFGIQFNYGHSGLISYDWIPNGTGSAHGETDTGVDFDVDILLSVAFPQDERIGMTPAQVDLFESVGATFGAAWINASSDIGEERLFVSWLQYQDSQGMPVTVFAPIQSVLDDDWDRLQATLPIYLDYLDELWSMDEGSTESGSDNPSEEFERKATWSLRIALIEAGGVVLTAGVAVVAVVTSTAAAATAAATIILGGITTIIALGVIVGVQQAQLAQLFEELREALRDGACGFPNDTIDVDTLTWEQLLSYARQYCTPV